VAKKSYPLLENLIAMKLIYLDENEYVGIASDGTEVNLGYIGNEKRIEYYLQSNPTPSTW